MKVSTLLKRSSDMRRKHVLRSTDRDADRVAACALRESTRSTRHERRSLWLLEPVSGRRCVCSPSGSLRSSRRGPWRSYHSPASGDSQTVTRRSPAQHQATAALLLRLFSTESDSSSQCVDPSCGGGTRSRIQGRTDSESCCSSHARSNFPTTHLLASIQEPHVARTDVHFPEGTTAATHEGASNSLTSRVLDADKCLGSRGREHKSSVPDGQSSRQVRLGKQQSE